MPPAGDAPSPNHWTAREVPVFFPRLHFLELKQRSNPRPPEKHLMLVETTTLLDYLLCLLPDNSHGLIHSFTQ